MIGREKRRGGLHAYNIGVLGLSVLRTLFLALCIEAPGRPNRAGY